MEKLKKKKWGKLLQENSALLSLILLLLLATIFKGEVFLNYKNIINIFLNNAIIGVIALGMTLVIITGGIDLSVGSQIALSGLIAVSVFNATGSAFIAVVAAILFGILTSAMCGAISAYCNVPPFIVTLATMRIFRSLAQYFFTGGGIQVRGDVDKYLIISDIKVFGVIPIIIIYWLILTVIVAVFSKKTAVGRHIFAVGSNEKATMLSGINTKHVKVAAYAILGGLVGVAAVMESARLGSMNSASSGINYEMDAIASVVIGGTSMAGGSGKVMGTFIGTLTLGIINNMLNLLGVTPFLISAAKGLIILLAVLLQTRLQKLDRD